MHDIACVGAGICSDRKVEPEDNGCFLVLARKKGP